MMVRPLFILSCLLALAGCGGGGGGGGSGGGGAASATSVVSCGSPSGATASEENVLPVSVKTCGVVSTVNMPYVDVTVCAPGSTTDCKTIGYVLVDTASYGLRIFASALDSLPNLPQQTEGGDPLVECAQFVSSYMWGNVRRADIRLGGLTASNVPMQVVGDPSAPSVPSACANSGTALNSASVIGANGILGVGPFIEDLGSYYRCSGSSCSTVAVSLANQVRNPVAVLASDYNNGVLLDMDPVASAGAATGSGSLILGIGTRANNALGTAVAYGLDSGGYLWTTYGGSTIYAFVDSGSNGLFFDEATLATCTSGWYCPSTTQSLSATVRNAANTATVLVNFEIANTSTLFASGNRAYGNLGAPWGQLPSEFDWGLPFFYGRPVFTAIDGAATPGGTGPYVAF